MTIRCPGCNAEQQRPAPTAERPLCMRCGESLAPALANATVASPKFQEGDFTARTMSMVRPSLANVESLPALSELVAQAAAEAQAAPPPPPQAQHKQWHVRTGAGAQFGPLATEEVQRWLAEGRLDAATIAWRPGQPDWQPLATAMGPQAVAAAPAPPVRDTHADDAHAAARAPQDAFLGPADGSDQTSVTSRPTVLHVPAKRRWPVLAAATAVAAALAGAGVWMIKSLRAPTSQEAAVVSDVPTPAAAPTESAPNAPAAPATPATPDAKSAEVKSAEADDAEPAPAPKGKRKHGGRNRGHKRRGHHRPSPQ